MPATTKLISKGNKLRDKKDIKAKSISKTKQG